MKKQLWNYALLTVLMLLIGGCNTVGNTCLTGGCYGPFEMTIKTVGGEPVKDVIVRLVYITASTYSEGSAAPSYHETVLSDTDKIIRFPRGFILRTDDKNISLNLSIIHPDYQSLDLYGSFPNKQGPIDLGEKFMIRAQDAMDASIAKSEADWRKAGLSEEEIEKKFAGKREFNPSYRIAASTRYFAYAVSIGRQDIIDKYLPQMLRDDIEYRNAIGKPIGKSYDELYQLYHDEILERAQRYAR